MHKYLNMTGLSLKKKEGGEPNLRKQLPLPGYHQKGCNDSFLKVFQNLYILQCEQFNSLFKAYLVKTF